MMLYDRPRVRIRVKTKANTDFKSKHRTQFEMFFKAYVNAKSQKLTKMFDTVFDNKNGVIESRV